VILVIKVSSCWESIPDLAEKSGSGRRKVRRRKKSCCNAKQKGKERRYRDPRSYKFLQKKKFKKQFFFDKVSSRIEHKHRTIVSSAQLMSIALNHSGNPDSIRVFIS